jgi:DNA polymerase II small subunit
MQQLRYRLPSWEEEELVVVKKLLELGYQVELGPLRRLLEQEGGTEPTLRILDSIMRAGSGRRDRRFVIGMKEIGPHLRATSDAQKAVEAIVPDFEVVFDPTGMVSPTADPSGYVQLFRSRLSKMSSVIRNRPDFFQIEKSNAIKSPSSNKKVLAKVVGLVVSKRVTADYVSLTLEDDSGYLRLMCTDEATRKVEEMLLDEFVLAEVESLPRGYYARNLYHPDVPDRAKHVAGVKVYALFVSDLRVGSSSFDASAFQKLIDWINGELGESEIVSRIRYLVLNGDLIDDPLASGSHPEHRNIESCYDELATYLGNIKRSMKIFVVPGETDATRIALPQPAIIRRYTKKLYGMKDVVMLGNPSFVRLHGVGVLLYHGQSLDDVFRQLQSASASRPATGVKALLRARHVAPTYGGMTSIAAEREDMLVIEPIPDIIHCGHVGVPDEDMYRGTLMLTTPSWADSSQGIAKGQGRAAVVDLSTFDVLWRI